MKWIMGVIVALSLINTSYALEKADVKRNAIGYNVDVIQGISYRHFLTDKVALEAIVWPSLRNKKTEHDSLSAEETSRGVDLMVAAMKTVAGSDRLRLNVGAGWGYSYERRSRTRSDDSRETVSTHKRHLGFGCFGIEVFPFRNLSVESRLGFTLSQTKSEDTAGDQTQSRTEEEFSFFRNNIDILKPLSTVSVHFYF